MSRRASPPVVITNRELAIRVDDHIFIARGFALVDASKFQAVDREWMKRHYGAKRFDRYTLPLFHSQATQLPGLSISPESLRSLRLSSVTSDRQLYRQGHDRVRLLAIDAMAAASDQVLLITASGVEFARRVVRLDDVGVGTLELDDLPAGEYAVSWATRSDDEAQCEFSVAAFRLAPLVASLVRQRVHGESQSLWLMLNLETYGVPAEGRVRLELTDRGRPVAWKWGDAKTGHVYGSFVLRGDGPHAVNVQLLDDPSKTATVPLVGSRSSERKPTVFSRLGKVVQAALLPGSESHEVRGLFLDEYGIESSPVRLARVDCETIRLETVAEIQALCIQVIDPYKLQASDGGYAAVTVSHEFAETHEVIEFDHDGPLSFLAVAGFVNGEPWEGWAAVVSPSQLEPQIKLPSNLIPGHEAKLEITAGERAQSVYVVVKDARLSASDTPASRLAGELKRGVDRCLGDLLPNSPPAARLIRDPVGILLLHGLISLEQMRDAEALAHQRDISIAEALIRKDYITSGQMLKAIARHRGDKFVELGSFYVPQSVIELVPESVARENVVLPLALDEGVLTVAMANADDYFEHFEVVEKLRFILNRNVETVSADRDEIRESINRHYGQVEGESADSMLMEFTDTAIDFTETEYTYPSTETGGGGFDLTSAESVASTSTRARQQPMRQANDVYDVLFAGLLPLSNGRTETTVQLSRGICEYTVDAIAFSGGDFFDWASTSTRFQAFKNPYAALDVPAFVHVRDGAEGRVHFGVASGRARVHVTRNGEPVALRFEDRFIEPDEVLSTERGELTFIVTNGQYQASVEDVESSETDLATQRVDSPGCFEQLERPIRLLSPGDEISTSDDKAIQALRVLPGLKKPFHALVEATADYQHCCCEQTAARLLAAAAMYATADDHARRKKAEGIIFAGVRRQESMWLPGRGFKSYPTGADVPDQHWGSIAARHLYFLELLREGGSDRPNPELNAAIDKAFEMARDVSVAHRLSWPPESPTSSADAYAALRFSSSASVQSRSLEWIRKQAANSSQQPEFQRKSSSNAVRMRIDDAYAAAALLRGGKPADLPTALNMANRVVQDLGPNGRLYSTVDSVAAIALISELRAARIVGNDGDVSINGQLFSISAAVALAQQVNSIRATTNPVAVELLKIRQDNWDTFANNVGVHVSLQQSDAPRREFRVAETLELIVTLRGGYHTGDLLAVCLPDSLSRVHAGGQIKHFAVDFEGQDKVSVPLVTTGRSMNDQGVSAPHHFAVCVRNMYDEERAGNPGLLELMVAGSKG